MSNLLTVSDGIALARSLQAEGMTEEQYCGSTKVISLSPKVRTYLITRMAMEKVCQLLKKTLRIKMRLKIKLKLEKTGKLRKYGEIIKALLI
jgi:hypothetical protein